MGTNGKRQKRNSVDMEMVTRKGRKSWTAWLEGSTLFQRSATQGGSERTTTKEYASPEKAEEALQKAVRKKMSGGFFQVGQKHLDLPFALDETGVERSPKIKRREIPKPSGYLQPIRNTIPPQLTGLVKEHGAFVSDGPGDVLLWFGPCEDSCQLRLGRRHLVDMVEPHLRGRLDDFHFRHIHPVRPDQKAMLVALRDTVYELDVETARARELFSMSSESKLRASMPFGYSPSGETVLYRDGGKLMGFHLEKETAEPVLELGGEDCVGIEPLIDGYLAVLQPSLLTIMRENSDGFQVTHRFPCRQAANLSVLLDGRILMVFSGFQNTERPTVALALSNGDLYEMMCSKKRYRRAFDLRGRHWIVEAAPGGDVDWANYQLFNLDLAYEHAIRSSKPVGDDYAVALPSLTDLLSKIIFEGEADGEAKVRKLCADLDHDQLLPRKGCQKPCIWTRPFNSPLHHVVQHGKPELLALLLELQAEPDVFDVQGKTPLVVALEKGEDELAEMLLSAGASIDPPDSIPVGDQQVRTQKPLVAASHSNRYELARRLLEEGAPVDGVGHDNHTALTAALAAENKELSQLLIDEGASVDAVEGSISPLSAGMKDPDLLDRILTRSQDVKGETGAQVLLNALGIWNGNDGVPYPAAAVKLIRAGARNTSALALGQACRLMGRAEYYDCPIPREEYAEIVKALLEAGADPNASHPQTRFSPLSHAVCYPEPVFEMVTALLDAGADVNGLGGNQIPPLRFAIGNNKGREVIDRLLEEGADPECDGSAWTALHEATCVGKIDLVGDLLSRGAKLDALTQDGRTALGVAADANQTEMMRFLLEKGIGPDEGENEWTPLMAAARHDNGEGVRMLLEAGANEDRRAPFPWDRFDNTKRSALEHAQAKGAKNAMSAFSGQRGDRFATLRQAVEANDLEEARRMLARGDEVNPEAEPPLSAVKSEEMLRVLLEAGAEVNRSDDKGATPLMTVAASELPDASEMAEMLIDNGAKVDSKDQRKETALHYAARAGNLEVARKLIEKGATVDFKYHTPLHVAARAGHAEMCRFLLKKGARHDIFDLASYFGRRTPLHEAAAQGHTDVAEILLEAGADPAVQDPTEGDDYDESYWAHGGYNAIHLAAEGGHYETLKRLLAHDQKGGVFMQVARRKYAHELAEDHPQCQALIQAVTDDKSTVEGFEEKQRAEIQEAERQLQAALKGSDPFVLQVAEPELYHGVSKTTGAFTLGPGDWAMTNGADKSIVLKSSRGEYVLAVGDEHGLHDLPVELRARSFPFEFSPDGFELLVHADGRLYLIDTRTRSMTKLIESKRTLGSFGFAGEHVFVQVGKQLKLFSLEDGSIEEIWKIPLRKEIGDTFCTGTPFVGFRLADDKSSVVFCVLDEEGFHHHSKLAKTVVQSWFIRREGRPTSTISFMRSDWVDSRCEWYQIQNHRQLEVGAPEKSALGARALKKLPETTFIKSPAIVELPR